MEAKPIYKRVLIKISGESLAGEKKTGIDFDIVRSVCAAVKTIVDMGVEVVAVSLGVDGAMILRDTEALYAKKLNIEVKSTVGAGDSMVAGLVAGFMAEHPLEETFRMGMACATARCMTEGYRIIDRTVYKALMDMVVIERI